MSISISPVRIGGERPEVVGLSVMRLRQRHLIALPRTKESQVAKIIVVNHVTLDGVMQAPGRPDEDTRGGFGHGGWAIPGNDEVMGRKMGEGMAKGGGLLLGRRTYVDFYGFWPNQPDNPFTEVLNNVPKYVASRTLKEPLPWANSILLGGDAADAVAKLKEQPIGDLTIMGSGELIGSLMAAGLIDEYLLMMHPLVLGTGRRLFAEGSHASLRLTYSVTTTTGVVIATYEARD
jgi:dihydrofolate reductase